MVASRPSARFVDEETIWFRREIDASLWMKNVLEREKVISEYNINIYGKDIYLDLVLSEDVGKRNKTLTVIELKRNEITLADIYAKLFSNYPQAIAQEFGYNRNYMLVFLGGEIEHEAEQFVLDFNFSRKQYPTKTGVLKNLYLKAELYEDFLTDYVQANSLDEKYIKMVRNAYGALNGHQGRMPFIPID